MSLTNLLTNEHSSLFYIIISIIPVCIIIIGGILLLKWYDKRIASANGGRTVLIKDKNLNKILIETSSQETHINIIKENINQTIKHRNLISRIKLEVQSFEEMINTGKRFSNDNLIILNDLANDLGKQIDQLKEYIELKNGKISEFLIQMVDQKKKILLHVQQSVFIIIQCTKTSDYKKFTESLEMIEFDYQAIVKLYQILTLHIQEQIGVKNNT